MRFSTEIIWELADEQNIPIIGFINKLDRENADFKKGSLSPVQSTLTRQIVPIQLPIGKEDGFNGMVDLISQKAYKYDNGKATEIPVPDDMKADIEHYREMMIEAAAEGDDEITMKYLDGEELTDAEIILGLKEGVKNAKVVPVVCGCATKNIGSDKLFDILVDYAPSPLAKLDASCCIRCSGCFGFQNLG